MKIEIISTGIFIYCTFSVFSATAADRFYTSLLETKSLKGGSFYEPDNAVIPDLAFFSNYPSVQYQLASRVICAIVTNNVGGIAYTYQDGVCTIYGPGEGSSGPSNIYAIAALPSLDQLECVSCGKQTYSSFASAHSRYAVDGVHNTAYSSIEPIHKPWWIVDLGETRTVYQVMAFPRRDGGGARFHDVEIRIGSQLNTNGDLTSYTLICFCKGPFNADEGFVVCTKDSGISGRYISLQKVVMGTNALQVFEVIVIGRK